MSVFQLKNVNYLDNNIIYCAMPLVLLIKDYNGDLAFPKNAPTINITMIFFGDGGEGLSEKHFLKSGFGEGKKHVQRYLVLYQNVIIFLLVSQ